MTTKFLCFLIHTSIAVLYIKYAFKQIIKKKKKGEESVNAYSKITRWHKLHVYDLTLYRLVGTMTKILYSFSESGKMEMFRAESYGKPILLSGPGVLFISKDRAYFQESSIKTLVSHSYNYSYYKNI